MRPEPKVKPGMRTRSTTRPYRAATVLNKTSRLPSEAFTAGRSPEAQRVDSPASKSFESSLVGEVGGEFREKRSSLKCAWCENPATKMVTGQPTGFRVCDDHVEDAKRALEKVKVGKPYVVKQIGPEMKKEGVAPPRPTVLPAVVTPRPTIITPNFISRGDPGGEVKEFDKGGPRLPLEEIQRVLAQYPEHIRSRFEIRKEAADIVRLEGDNAIIFGQQYPDATRIRGGEVFAAQEDGKTVGGIITTPKIRGYSMKVVQEEMPGRKPKREVSFFYVDPERRGQGLGRRLLSEALRGDGDVVLSTDNSRMNTDPSAVHLYEKAGFEPVRREENSTYWIKKQAAEKLRPGPGEFAPGIPGERGIRKIPKVKPYASNQEWTASLSMHPAARRGDHHDLRLIDPKGQAHSWAFQDVPPPGKSTYAVQQPTHKKRYALRTEPFTIPEGYGATRPGAQVEPKFVAGVEVVEADNKKVRFLKHDGQQTQEFVLRNLAPAMGTVKPMWAIHNATKNRDTGEGQKIPAYKPKYVETTPDKIDLKDQNQIMTPKIDGAHVLVSLPGEGERFARVFSYRPTNRETGLIEHTFKFPGFQKRRGTPETKNTMIRAEAWATDSKGKAIPAEQLGGLLNAGVLKSRQKQQELGLKLHLTGIDVVRHAGKNYENKPFAEKIDVLNRVNKATRGYIEVPEMAATPEQKQKMLEQIRNRQRADTEEGVVLHNLAQSTAPIKAKFKPDQDVYVTGVFKKPAGAAKGWAGGFTYSLEPDGPEVGRVGTGFNAAVRKDMLANPDKYVGRVARVESVRTGQQATGKALRAPAFKNWHLDKTDPRLMEEDHKLLKSAAKEETPSPHPRDVGAALAIAAGAGTALSPSTRGSLLGYKRVYHGTTPESAEAIKREGFRTRLGGMSGRGTWDDPEFVSEARGKVHFTASKPSARFFATAVSGKGAIGEAVKAHQAHGAGKISDEQLQAILKKHRVIGSAQILGGMMNPLPSRSILTADIPYQIYDKFDIDPYTSAPGASSFKGLKRDFFRNIASRSHDDVPKEFVHGGGSSVGRLKDLAHRWPSYVKAHPGRFAVGLGAAALGTAGVVVGARHLLNRNHDGSATKEASAAERLHQAWNKIKSKLTPEEVLAQAEKRSGKVRVLRPIIEGAAEKVEDLITE